MSDDELSARVEAGGKVFIGFKNPGAAWGVDEYGRVLASTSSIAAAKVQTRALGIDITFEFIDFPTVVARVPAALVAQLRRNPLVEYIEPIFPGERHAQITPWNVTRVGAPTAWSSSTGSGAKLLIIDSGIENTHPDLAPAVIQACDGTDGIDYTAGHGTAVAGIAAAVNNSIQIVGVAHGVALWTSKDGNEDPSPEYTACGVQFGRINGVHAINISTGYPNSYTGLTDQINAAYSAGVVVVASAGNTFGGAVRFPASLPAVIAVSATDTSNAFASFSSVGSKVEITAPGATVTNSRGLTSTCLGGTSCSTLGGPLIQGTSFSAPAVAAAAALLKAYNSSWTNVDIRERLNGGATDLGTSGCDNQFGYGLLNIPAAIAYVPPPPTYGADITGPSEVLPNDVNCYWTASTNIASPSFEWRVGGTLISTASTVWYSAASDFTLELFVSNSSGHTATKSKFVAVTIFTSPCAA